MHQLKNRRVAATSALSLAVGLSMAATARAQLTIIPTYDTSITSDPNAATIEATIQAAIAPLEAKIKNPITVNIDFQEMSGGLGQSSTSFSDDIPYTQYLNDLKTKQMLSTKDATAIASLPAGPNNPANNSSNVFLTAPLARALGETGIADKTSPTVAGTFDSIIGLNTGITNISRSGPQVSGNYDLQSVVQHEVDEVLGIGGSGSALSLPDKVTYSGQASPTGEVGVLDLFRYSAPGVRSFTLDNNAHAYFSIDGGANNLVNFNQAGSGSDFADWGDGVTPADGNGNTPPQVQDAFGSPSDAANLGTNELTALDVVGYNLVPEPTSLGLIAIGTLGLLARRRRA